MGAARAHEVGVRGDLNGDPGLHPDHLVATAERLLWEHRRRRQLFPQFIGTTPDWTILLSLFVSGERGEEMGVVSACTASGAPKTTALRYIDTMVRHGDVVRTPSPRDRRAASIRLSDKARLKMRALLMEFRPAAS